MKIAPELDGFQLVVSKDPGAESGKQKLNEICLLEIYWHVVSDGKERC